jgi:hypothetical protein
VALEKWFPMVILELRGPPGRVSAWVVTAALIWLAPACRRDEITYARVPKSETAAAPAGSGGGPPPGMPGAMPSADVPAPPAPAGSSALRWELPKGWTESTASGMRYATLKPSVAGKIDVSVVVLPGPAGGELANVNRWRGQIGLPPVDEPALAAARKAIQTRAGTVSLYDFTSEGQAKTRMIAGLLAAADGNSWFVKMVGDAGPVGTARPDFLHLLETLRFD